MKHLMVDLETMGKTNNAAIISIGAVFFDESAVYCGNSFYSVIDLQSSLDLGLTVDASTILWWLQQNETARKEFARNGNDIQWVLNKLSEFIDIQSDRNKFCIWGNGANFDVSILQNAYEKSKLEIPWRYNNVRCFRTLKAMSPAILNVPKDRTAHNALEDAIWQAEYAVEVINKRFK